MKISCPINTQPILEHINKFNKLHPNNQIGVHWGYNLIGVWQTKMRTTKLPDMLSMEAYMKEWKKDDVLTAVPLYNGGKNTYLPARDPHRADFYITSVSDKGRISLHALPGETEKDKINFFFNYIKGEINTVGSKNRKAVFNKLFEELVPEKEPAPIVLEKEEIAELGKGFVNHSGGAEGSDYMWGAIGEQFGVVSNHYYQKGFKTPVGNTPLTKEQLKEADEHLIKANETLGRTFPAASEITNSLLRRNWFQVKNADAIYAIGRPDKNNSNVVSGGTAWAVQMAIDEGKPVYVYDLNSFKWFQYVVDKETNTGKWQETGTPTLTKNFAGIGTRGNKKNKKELATISAVIQSVYAKTFEKELNELRSAKKQALQENESDSQTEEADIKEAQKEAPKSNKRTEKEFRELIQTQHDAALFMLYKTQAYIIRGETPNLYANSSTEKDLFLEEITTKEAFSKLEKYKKLHKNSITHAPTIGKDTVKGKLSTISKLNQAFSASERREEARQMAILFNNIVQREKQEQAKIIRQRINDAFVSKNASAMLRIRELEKELEALNDPYNIDIINKKGVDYFLVQLKNTYWNNIIASLDELEDQYKNYSNYVKITLKKNTPAEQYDEAVKNHCIKVQQNSQRVMDNFDALLDLAKAELIKRYGIELRATEAILSSTVKREDEEGRNTDEQDNEIGYLDGWMQTARETDPVKTLSREIKVTLANIIDVTPEGKARFDSLGRALTLTPQRCYTIMLIEASKLIYDEQFGDKTDPLRFFKEFAKKYTWGKQVLKKLAPKGEPDLKLITKFYVALRMQFVPYWQTRTGLSGMTEDGYSSPLNITQSQQGTYQSARANIERGNVLNKQYSIYKSDGSPNFENMKKVGELITNKVQPAFQTAITNSEEDFSSTAKILAKQLANVLTSLGIEVTQEELIPKLSNKDKVIEILNRGLNAIVSIINTKPEWVNEDRSLFDASHRAYEKLAKVIGTVKTETIQTGFNQGGKNKYSFSAINYLDKLIKSLGQEAYDTYYANTGISLFDYTMSAKFNRDGFFYDRDTDSYKAPWLKQLNQRRSYFRKIITYKQIDSIDGEKYENWTAPQLQRAFFIDYLNANENKNATLNHAAYYHAPIFSDSTALIMIRAPKYVGASAKRKVVKDLVDVALQEVYRISKILERTKKRQEDKKLEAEGKKPIHNIQPIANYDQTLSSTGDVLAQGGAEFKFFPDLNDPSKNIYKKVQEFLNSGKVSEARKLLNTELTEIMKNGYEKFANEKGIVAAAEEIFGKEDAPILMEEYYYNSVLATSQIIELTTVDVAFYKNVVDFQKRYKEVYAAGKRFCTFAQKGKQLRNVMTIRDQVRPSTALANISRIVLNNEHLSQKEKLIIIDKFKHVNGTDAQSYLTPDAMEAMMDMLGQLDSKLEKLIQKLKRNAQLISEGKPSILNAGDYDAVFQTIKQFTYTVKYNEDLVGYTPLQHKNSEALLGILLNLIQGDYNKSGKLKALGKFMQNNDIDVCMFESAVKVGGHSVCNLNYSEDRFNRDASSGKIEIEGVFIDTKDDEGNISFDTFLDNLSDALLKDKITEKAYRDTIEKYDLTEEEATDLLNSYYLDSNGTILSTKIDRVPYEDVMIAQDNPEHLMDEIASFGTQIASLIMSDIPDDAEIIVNDKKLTMKQVKDLYQDLRIANVIAGFDKTVDRLRNTESMYTTLINTINSNTSYNRDLAGALQIVKVDNPITGAHYEGFNLPLHTPSIRNQLNQIIFAEFKNGVTKQKINGGTATLVSSFGYSSALEIESDGTKITAIQCYLPAWTKKFYQAFMKNDGSIDFEKLQKENPELLKLIGYRVPTEGKYSMVPLKVMGFLPAQCGSSIMLPADITTLSGSDYDIDKLFLMIPNSTFSSRINVEKLKTILFNLNPKFREWDKGEISNKEEKEGTYSSRIDATIERFLNGETFPKGSIEDKIIEVYAAHREELTINKLTKVKYDPAISPLDQTKEARDNMIMDLFYGVLTSNEGAKHILRPGNFDDVTSAANKGILIQDQQTISLAAKELLDTEEINEENAKSVATQLAYAILNPKNAKKIDKIAKKLRGNYGYLDPSTFIKFHTINTQGKKLVGICANSTTHQAKTQNTGLQLKYPITLMGQTVQQLDEVKGGTDNHFISNVCAQFSAASVDDAKAQNLAYINMSGDTANTVGLLERMGKNIEEISMVLLNPTLMNPQAYKFSQATTAEAGKMSSAEILAETIAEKLGTTVVSDTTKASMHKLGNTIKVASKSILEEHIKYCRADSPNGALDHSLAKVYIQLLDSAKASYKWDEKMDYMQLSNGENLRNIDPTTLSQKKIFELCKLSNIPTLAAFRWLGIESSRYVLKDKLIGLSPNFMNLVYNFTESLGIETMSDKVLNKLFEGYITYELSGTKLFGKDDTLTILDKRKYYIERFPHNLAEIRRKHPNNKFIQSLEFYKGQLTIPSPSTFTQDWAQTLKDEAVQLLTVDPTLASHLLCYAYFTTGLNFAPNSISYYLMTADFLENFPEIVDTLRFMKIDDNFDQSKFLNQLLSNIDIDYIAAKTTKSNIKFDQGQGMVSVSSSVIADKTPPLFISWITLDRTTGKKINQYARYTGNIAGSRLIYQQVANTMSDYPIYDKNTTGDLDTTSVKKQKQVSREQQEAAALAWITQNSKTDESAVTASTGNTNNEMDASSADNSQNEGILDSENAVFKEDREAERMANQLGILEDTISTYTQEELNRYSKIVQTPNNQIYGVLKSGERELLQKKRERIKKEFTNEDSQKTLDKDVCIDK